MTISIRNFALLLLPLLLVLFFPKLAHSNTDSNGFKLLIALLITIAVTVTLYIRNLSIEKKVIRKQLSMLLML